MTYVCFLMEFMIFFYNYNNMIVEAFSNTTNIEYNDTIHSYTIKDNSFFSFLFTRTIYEKDSSIDEINSLREQADITTLTNADIEKLYSYAKIKFNYSKTIADFKKDKLKDIFHNTELNIPFLIVSAYNQKN